MRSSLLHTLAVATLALAASPIWLGCSSGDASTDADTAAIVDSAAVDAADGTTAVDGTIVSDADGTGAPDSAVADAADGVADADTETVEDVAGRDAADDSGTPDTVTAEVANDATDADTATTGDVAQADTVEDSGTPDADTATTGDVAQADAIEDSGTPDTAAPDAVADAADADSATMSDIADTSDTAEVADTSDTSVAECVTPTGPGLVASYFLAGGLDGAITTVACTLDNGTQTTCYQITTVGAPADHEVGPFCPRSIYDTAADAGIWLSDGDVYDLDGDFIVGLAEFYGDAAWQLYDPITGDVKVTSTQAGCEAAAQPNVAAAYNNYCVECSLDYFGGGVTETTLIPVTPVARPTPAELGNGFIGLAFNGVQFEAPAPVAVILAAHTIAAFDDCGGHVNPVAGYHYHAATGCSKEVAQCDGHAPLIGYALDGYGIYAMSASGAPEPSDLDACRGHSDAARGYHYHSASAGENMFIGCYMGRVVGTTTDPGPGGGVPSCSAVPPGMPCCGDGTCGGPETAANCAADCP
jgi:hypothetical protein